MARCDGESSYTPHPMPQEGPAVLTHLCSACDKRQLIFPSQITAVADSDHGVLATFTCWCGAEQTAPLDLVPSRARGEKVLAA